jgi:hypothetical protein
MTFRTRVPAMFSENDEELGTDHAITSVCYAVGSQRHFPDFGNARYT